MQLYDKKSDIDWYYRGKLTLDQMKAVPELSGLATEPAVLYDGSDGKVFSFEWLSSFCARAGVAMTDDAQASYDSAAEVMSYPEPDLAADLKRLAQMQVATMDLTDAQAATVPSVYPDWETGQAYKVGDIVLYLRRLYKVTQAHTSQADWTPDKTPALFRVLDYGTDGIEVWNKDALASDPSAYNTGVKVHYPKAYSPVYVSKRDGHTSEPTKDEWWELWTN